LGAAPPFSSLAPGGVTMCWQIPTLLALSAALATAALGAPTKGGTAAGREPACRHPDAHPRVSGAKSSPSSGESRAKPAVPTFKREGICPDVRRSWTALSESEGFCEVAWGCGFGKGTGDGRPRRNLIELDRGQRARRAMGIDGGRGAARCWRALAVAMKSATLAVSRGAFQPRQEDKQAVGGA
jgi:hypothetical protein